VLYDLALQAVRLKAVTICGTTMDFLILALSCVSFITPAAAIINVNDTTGFLPARGDAFGSTQSGLRFISGAACPMGAFVSSWTIGLLMRKFSLAQGPVQVQMVTVIAGTCSNASGPPYRFLNHLWGYGSASAGFTNVSIASPLEGQSVTGVSLDSTSTIVGGIFSFMGVGSNSTFSMAIRWQDSCRQGSYINGYILVQWLPPNKNDSAAITQLLLSCSGTLADNYGSSLNGPRTYYPPFGQFLPLRENNSVSISGVSSGDNGSETWLPWKGASLYLLSTFSSSVSTVLYKHNLFVLVSRLCPIGSYLAQVEVAAAFARVLAFNASCADALTDAPVMQFARQGNPSIQGVTISIGARNATSVIVGSSDTSVGPLLASLFGVGEAALGVKTVYARCPRGQILDGYQLIIDTEDRSILSIRFHCSAIAGLDLPNPLSIASNGSSPFPATRGSSSPTDLEKRILDVINSRRLQAGVANLTFRAPEMCAALNVSSRIGNTTAPDCSLSTKLKAVPSSSLDTM
jgi:hypothetical protein